MRREESRTRWLWAFAPVNASGGIFLTLLPLYILRLGGNVVNVGIITSTYLFSLIPGALVWGFSLDAYPHRKGYIVLSYFGIGSVLILANLFSNLSLLSIFLALYGFISAAAVPAVNLIIMESSTKSSWADMVTNLSFASIIGYDVGVVIGFVWSSFFSIEPLIAASGILAIASGLLVLKFVPKPKMVLERKSILFSKEVFTHRLRGLPILLLNVPRFRDFRRLIRMLRLTFFREVPLLYFSVFVFNFGSNVFGTSYVPSLKQKGVLDNVVFLITLANTILQTLVFYYIHRKRFFDNHAAVDTTKWVLVIRGGTFLLIALLFMFFSDNALMTMNTMTFAVLGGTWAFYNVTTSYLVFRTLNSQRQGEILGIYTAIGGFFTFAGALGSGFISFFYGYPMAFFTAATLMLISLLLLELSARIGERVRVLHDIITYG